jgi:hypothetical protein
MGFRGSLRWFPCVVLLLALQSHGQAPEAKDQTLRQREANPARNAGNSGVI